MSVMESSGSVSVSGSKTLCFVDTDTDPDPDADGYISILRIAVNKTLRFEQRAKM